MILAAAAALLTSWVLVGLVMAIALRYGLMDIPNHRSSHSTPTARGGGIAIVIVVLVALAIVGLRPGSQTYFASSWATAGVLVSAAGLADDLRELSPVIRFGIHSIAGLIILSACGGLPLLSSPMGSIDLGVSGWLLGGAAIVWSINVYNFMDGIDGLAASQTVFVAAAGAVMLDMTGRMDAMQLPLLALAGASAGFLLWNFPPAKIFMGDVGSGFVGLSIAAAAFMTAVTGAMSLWTWLVLNGLFFADATTTVIMRLVRQERIYEAHRSHAYQRLARRWKSHRAVTLVYSAINITWCLPWAIATSRWQSQGPILAAAALAPLFCFAIIGGAGTKDR